MLFGSPAVLSFHPFLLKTVLTKRTRFTTETSRPQFVLTHTFLCQSRVFGVAFCFCRSWSDEKLQSAFCQYVFIGGYHCIVWFRIRKCDLSNSLSSRLRFRSHYGLHPVIILSRQHNPKFNIPCLNLNWRKSSTLSLEKQGRKDSGFV